MTEVLSCLDGRMLRKCFGYIHWHLKMPRLWFEICGRHVWAVCQLLGGRNRGNGNKELVFANEIITL